MSLGISGLSAINNLLDSLASTDASSFLPSSLTDSSASATPSAAPAASGAASGSGSSTASSLYGLSNDDFFKMFLAQLQNQDPTQPMDNAQMVNQLAQFSMIQTLNEVSASLQGSRLAEASALIGKQVTGFDLDGNTVTGVVSRVDQTSDGYYLAVGDAQIAPDSVSSVTNPPTSP